MRRKFQVSKSHKHVSAKNKQDCDMRSKTSDERKKANFSESR